MSKEHISNEQDRFFDDGYGMAKRRFTTLVVGFLGGCLSIILDLDHIICFALGIAPISPEVSVYGCRLYHGMYFDIAFYCLGVALTLMAGSIAYLVLVTIESIFATNNGTDCDSNSNTIR